MTTTSTHSENIDTAYALLAKGERQIAAGQYREGSASVYRGRVHRVALPWLKATGWPCETEEDVCNAIIHRLDGKLSRYRPSLSDAIKRGVGGISR